MAHANPHEAPKNPSPLGDLPPAESVVAAGHVRVYVVLATTLTAILLYLTRYNQSICEGWMRADLGLDKEQMSWVPFAFFLSYALAQVPSGWFSDRFGARRMMVIYILGWSLSVGLIGFASSLGALLVLRVVFGIFQAGAYPTANVLLRRWSTVSARGFASSTVALGGRLGGAIAPVLTAFLVLYFFARSNPTFDLKATPSPENVGDAWRVSFFVYAALGLVVAAIYAYVVRDYPSQHPRVNQAELNLIADGNPAAIENPDPAARRFDMPLLLLAKNRNMMLSSLGQFMTNVTWTFSATLLPQFLQDRFQTPVSERGYYTMMPMLMGVAGMFAGGFITDALVRRLGKRLGRAIPNGATKVIGAVAFVAAGYSEDAFTFALLIGLMALSTDLGVPAGWAMTQEIAGRHAGSAVGWGNMWGNIGAAISTPFITYLRTRVAEPYDLPTLPFWIGGVIFGLSGLCGLMMDATKPLEPEEEIHRGDSEEPDKK